MRLWSARARTTERVLLWGCVRTLGGGGGCGTCAVFQSRRGSFCFGWRAMCAMCA